MLQGQKISLVIAVLLVGLVPSALAQFAQVSPGGDTTCVGNTPYSFFWRPGTSGNLTVFFEGGGACWDAGSCALPIYSPTVDESVDDLDSLTGFLSTDKRSAVSSDTILYLPYCTADVHSGNNTANYGLYSINHKGRVNVEAALSFIQTQIAHPSRVVVAGCSAGSLGAFLNAPFVFNHFPGASSYVVWGDSEVGVLAENQYNAAVKNWDLQLAPWIPALSREYTGKWNSAIAGYIVYESALFYTNSLWGAYTSDYDAVQSTFYSIGGGTGSWTNLMRDQFTDIRGNATNVYSFIAPGSAHCVDEDDGYFGVTSNSVTLYQWVNQLINGDTSINREVDCAPNC